MRWKYSLYVIGAILVTIGLTMLFALTFSIYYGDNGIFPLIKSVLVTLGLGGALFYAFRDRKAPAMNHREGMAIVALGWIAAGLVGALPFWFGGVFDNVTDCVFESISGFTTTGSSVLYNIEAVPRGLLMWRSLTHWLGGMGIIVLSLAILPFLGIGGMQLYKAEVPGPVADKLKPRIKETAMLLWKVYVLFTLVEALLLLIGGMDLFEALAHSFGTMATGGFSVKNTSIAAYDSVYFDTVITIFMLIAGINFALHYHLLRGKPLKMLRDTEFRFFIYIFLIFTAITTLSIWGPNFDSFWTSLRYASFQIASILTTTGYGTADFEIWTPLPQALILLLMFMGGSAGSTSGGMKCMRIIVLCKHAYKELYHLIHPRAVKRLKLGGHNVSQEVINSIVGFFMLFLGIFLVSSFALAAMGMDIVSAFSAAASCIGNIGPGLGTVGPTDNFATVPTPGKWILIFDMLLGRLEIYTVIILFVPEFWRS